MIAERIASLVEVAALTKQEGDFSVLLRDFLDGFYSDPQREKVMEEPELLCEVLHDGGVADAYIAAVCDQLCRQNRFTRPAWIKQPTRFLKYPYFAAKTHGLRMIYLQESPSSFKERNLFVSANALFRV